MTHRPAREQRHQCGGEGVPDTRTTCTSNVAAILLHMETVLRHESRPRAPPRFLDLLRVPPLVRGDQLDPLIHGHRARRTVIERHLTQRETVASSKRGAKCRVAVLERRPARGDIDGACRLRRLRRLPLVLAIASCAARRAPAAGHEGAPPSPVLTSVPRRSP